MSEYLASVPIIEQAAAALKETGFFHQELTRADVVGIMQGVVNGLLTDQDKVRAGIPTMDVRIENQQALVTGSVRLEKPIKATIQISCVLANDQKPQRLRLVRLDIQEKAGLAARAVLKAVNIKGKAKSALSDPNRALFAALGEQLKPKGIELTGIGLHFREEALVVGLKGKPARKKTRIF